MPTGCAPSHVCTQCVHTHAQGTCSQSRVCAHMSPKCMHVHRHMCTWAQACTHNKCMCSHTHVHIYPGLPEYLKGWGHRVKGDLCLFQLLPSQGVPHHTGLPSCGHPAHASATVTLATLSTGFLADNPPQEDRLEGVCTALDVDLGMLAGRPGSWNRGYGPRAGPGCGGWPLAPQTPCPQGHVGEGL